MTEPSGVKKRNAVPVGAFELILGVALGVNGLFYVLRLTQRAFNHDEFQHTHIAWLVSRGQVIYRDFFEHHGPLLALVNAMLLRARRDAVGFETLLDLRWLSAAFLVGMIVLVYLLGRRVFGDHRLGLLAAVIFSGLLFVQDKGMEIRPDLLQNLLWLAALYVLGGSLQPVAERPPRFFESGLLLGFMLLANLKSLVGLPAIGLVLVLYALRRDGEIWSRLSPLVSTGLGLLMPLLGVALGFLRVGGLESFIYYSLIYNLQFLPVHQTNTLPGIARFFMERQTGFSLLVLIGGLVLVLEILRRGQEVHLARLLILLGALIPALLLAGSGLYAQNYLVFLPLMSLIAAYGLLRIMQGLARLGPRPHAVLGSALLVLVMASASAELWRSTPRGEQPWLGFQREHMQYVLSRTERGEIVANYQLNDCGGYTFNENLQFYWMTADGMDQVYERREGYPVFGEAFVRALERAQPSYIVGWDHELDWFPEVTQQHMRQHYDFRTCLWKRKGIPWD